MVGCSELLSICSTLVFWFEMIMPVNPSRSNFGLTQFCSLPCHFHRLIDA